MGIKKYILFSLIFIAAIGAYVYSFNGDTFTLTFFGVPLTLYVAIWVVLPVAILAIATVLHMMYYSFKGYLGQRNLQKDYKSFINYAKNRLLNLEPSVKFITKWYKLPANILQHFKFDPSKEPSDIEDDELKSVINDLRKIENGEVVELKKYKLPKDNYFVKKNILNRLENDRSYASILIKECDDKESEVCKKAFEIFIDEANSLDEIKNTGFDIDKELFERLMSRFVNKEDNFKIQREDIAEYFKKFKFTKDEYLKYAKMLKNLFNPEAVLSIFDKLAHEKENALEAYLYLLFEFQMIDKAREIIQNTQKGECEKFKYLLYLKDCGKNFDIDIFF